MFYRKPGFGLAEALVGSGIVVMVAAGSVGLGNSILKNTRLFSDQIVASNLAAEPIELIHYIRNKNIDANREWFIGLQDCQESCKINPIRSEKQYTQLENLVLAKGVDTIVQNDLTYKRKTTIKLDVERQKIDVIVTVTSNDASGLNESVTKFNTTLTNWKVVK